MAILIVGLIAFLGLHSVRVMAEPWRARQLAALGEMRWKGLYSLASIVALVLVVWGFGRARINSPVLWVAPAALHYVTAALVLVAFVLATAAYVPRNRIRAATRHPLTLGVKTWSFAHLLSAGTLADVVLFGSFLAWSVAVFAAARRRDRAAGAARPEGSIGGDAVVLVVGVVAWAVFAAWLHRWLIGVGPFA